MSYTGSSIGLGLMVYLVLGTGSFLWAGSTGQTRVACVCSALGLEMPVAFFGSGC